MMGMLKADMETKLKECGVDMKGMLKADMETKLEE